MAAPCKPNGKLSTKTVDKTAKLLKTKSTKTVDESTKSVDDSIQQAITTDIRAFSRGRKTWHDQSQRYLSISEAERKTLLRFIDAPAEVPDAEWEAAYHAYTWRKALISLYVRARLQGGDRAFALLAEVRDRWLQAQATSSASTERNVTPLVLGSVGTTEASGMAATTPTGSSPLPDNGAADANPNGINGR